MTIATPAFAASASQPDDGVSAAELAVVMNLMRAHAALRPACLAKGPDFATDINGTLDHPAFGPLIDRFLSDMHQRGASVMIVSGMLDNNLGRYEIARRLAGDNVSQLGAWGHENASWFGLKGSYGIQKSAGFLFDDDQSAPLILKTLGGTCISLHRDNVNMQADTEFLRIWPRMSETQKDEAARLILAAARAPRAHPAPAND